MTRRLAVAIPLVLTGCGGPGSSPPPPAPSGPPWFESCGEARGLDFEHRSGHADRFLLPEIMGGGVALVDLENDGDLDAYFVQSGSLTASDSGEGNQLYRNDGRGHFTNITAGSGADDRGYGMGVAAGDFDADGDTDLYVTNVGPNVLLRNEGGGRFSDVTATAGVGHPGWSTSAAFLDYDQDGDLDLYVANYIRWSISTELTCYNEAGGPDYCSPKNYNASATDALYRNDGDGTFTDVTEAAGMTGLFGNGLGVVAGDFTNDGRVDLFVANDGTPDQLWVNGGDGTFHDEAMLRGCAIDLDGVAKAGMGVAAADLDDDADLDLLVVNLRHESDSLYRNEPGGFVDATAAMGLAAASRPYTRFGLAFADFDNDGQLDLYQANGRVQQLSPLHTDDPFAEPNVLWRGTAEGRFELVTPPGGTNPPVIGTSRGAAFGDIDGDGAVDIVIVNRDAPATLLRGHAASDHNWIIFKAVDGLVADAIGATIAMEVGPRIVTRDVRSAYSYCAANDPRVHLGLGEAEGVTGVSVRWVDGTRESFGDFAANQVVTLRRGEGGS